MGKFKKGADPRRNTSGRPPGQPNKSTEALRNAIHDFIEDNLPRLQEDFDALKPIERLNLLNSMLRHVLPDPLSLERLSESQLDELLQFVKLKYKSDEQADED